MIIGRGRREGQGRGKGQVLEGMVGCGEDLGLYLREVGSLGTGGVGVGPESGP